MSQQIKADFLSQFQKADADLDYLSRKLEYEFSNDAEKPAEKPNPVKMLKKIADIKQEYAEIVKEAEAIKASQKDAMDFFRSELMTLCETLGRLQQNVGIQPEKCDDLDKVSEGLGLGGSDAGGPQAEEEGAAAAAAAVSPASDDPPSGGPQGASQKETKVCETAAVQAVSPYARRADSDDLIDIDDDEFQTVSSVIRGRAKLADVNHTYRILWYHFKEQGNSDALSSSEMYKMGLRVTGQTGEAKLKVLRTLKLLSISKKGEVCLL